MKKLENLLLNINWASPSIPEGLGFEDDDKVVGEIFDEGLKLLQEMVFKNRTIDDFEESEIKKILLAIAMMLANMDGFFAKLVVKNTFNLDDNDDVDQYIKENDITPLKTAWQLINSDEDTIDSFIAAAAADVIAKQEEN
jgi:hypothetical protein